MKIRSLLLVVTLLIVAASSEAQETYSLPASAGNVTTLTEIITYANGNVCASLNLARTCTQAQACTAASVTGGASCTAANARAAKVRIYPLTTAGREEYSQFEIAQPRFNELAASLQPVSQNFDFCTAWTAASTANKNSCRTAISAAATAAPFCQP